MDSLINYTIAAIKSVYEHNNFVYERFTNSYKEYDRRYKYTSMVCPRIWTSDSSINYTIAAIDTNSQRIREIS